MVPALQMIFKVRSDAADVLKKSGVVEYVQCVLIFQKNVRCGDGSVVLVESLGALSTGDTPVSLNWCG